MFTNLRSTAVVSLVVIGSLTAFGCGGGDEDSSEPAATSTTGTTSAEPEITMAELITLGDGICAEVNAAVGTITASDSADPDVVETQVADIYSGMADRLAELGTPTDGVAPTKVVDAARALADSGAA
ncbi:MAG: hypothetical protein KDB62_05315, partial [Solirubrobacterales bacterium]|nr:hypothetical protein [Solirubrobacterales bacterium]